ncbi:uncharacterized protein LOC122863051 [Siniperca chuatsi]|uniref:uncharacterized protein LOC122863051 n=1 Tax=Siniperca chuatsi TaxID=119488 RepID=UPI001CE06A66|nr:uncharacterized protein LOC122863051 [Siniperca chuatsi]XP_044025046.1 uncharacterized protein LOC122863051 [Siniperca chuatsi]XP_044025047.1 uncharacterized protein LOC122863051 [Siniperca chuatsi]XP_044025048.1 uncharacterized protein LOC122863051 [Siniperca chuatsi]XP_044025049.1 uncharacterized protein LOC122863051 [Siniperca chuatsi]XP_044025050.1 uncharacterized protein LOC122863051 [Siniperca chuatsi]XP_044025051.1 uncharacterized protein LOC122863051 [Siniperca chuatsi]XP_04402505
MVQFRWINMSLFVILGLQFTAVIGQNPPSFIASVGDEITLPCENVIKNQDKCDSTSWVVSRHIRSSSQELVNLGQIWKNEISKAKSDRLSVTAKCSLVIKNVTVEDVGRYSCRQFRSGQQQGPDAHVQLSVINMDQHQNNDTDILFCTVLTYEGCEYTVEWLYEGNKNDLETSQLTCSATVTFTTPPLDQKSNYYELLKCNVTDNKSGQRLLCNVGLQSSCEKTGSTLVAISEKDETKQDLWWVIIVAVGLAALLIIIVVVVIRRKKTKGNKTQMDENVGLSLNPAVTQPDPETRQDMADPEDGVSYASISYTKKTNSKALVCSKDDDDDAAVTYSTVKASSSSAGASSDPSNLYATVNKPNKEEATV